MADIHPVRAFYNRMTAAGESAGHSAGLAPKQVAAAGHTIRQYGESMLTGAALGAAHSELKTGLDIQGKIPADGILAAVGAAAGLAMADHPDSLGDDARNVGAAAATVFAFRKTHDLMAAKKASSGGAAGGSIKKAAAIAGDSQEQAYGLGAGPNSDPNEQSLSKDDSFGDDDPIVAAARLL